MNRLALWIGMGALLAVGALAVPQRLFAQTTADRPVPGSRQADVHNPFSPRYRSMLPGQYDGRQTPVTPTQPPGNGGSTGNWYYYYGYPYGYVWPRSYGYYDYAWDPYYPPYYYNDWPYHRDPAYPLVLPPVQVPAESLYGPQAVRRFLGADQTGASAAPAPRAGGGRVATVAPRASSVRASSPQQLARAGRYLQIGDRQFASQKYHGALQRYRTAAQVAPELADTHLRQAFASIAMSQYESAARALRRALSLRSDWSDSTFRLDDLYGEDEATKSAHLEQLAEAVENNEVDPGLLMLLGTALYFDGQADRATVFFERAEQLGGNDTGLLDGFIPADGSSPANNRRGRVEF